MLSFLNYTYQNLEVMKNVITLGCVSLLIMWVCFQPNCAYSSQLSLIKHLSTEDGLSQRSISSVYASDSGYLWISTMNGVEVYDGYQFKPLEGSNQHLVNNFIFKMWPNTNNTIWFSVHALGLVEYDTQTGLSRTLIDNKDMHLRTPVVEVLPTGKGHLIFSNSAIYDYRQDTLVRLYPVTDDSSGLIITTAQQINVKQILLGTDQGGYVFDLDSRELSAVAALDDYNVIGIKTDNEQGILVFDYQGKISRYDIQSGEVSGEIDMDDKITAVTQDDDYFYVASETTVYRLASTVSDIETLVSLNDNYAQMRPKLSALSVSRDGKLWMGTASDGLFMWDSRAFNFTHFSDGTNESLVSGDVWSVYEDPASRHLWIGSSGGLDRLSLDTNTIQHFPLNQNIEPISPHDKLNPSHDVIYVILGKYGNELWLYGLEGLFLYDIEKQQSKAFSFPTHTRLVLEGGVDFYYMDNFETIWLAQGRTLWSLDMETLAVTKRYEFTTDSQVSLYNIMPSEIHSDELLLSSRDTLYRFNKTSEAMTILYRHEDKTDPQAFLFFESALYDRANQLLWLTRMDHGLVVVDVTTGKKIKELTHVTHGIDRNTYQLMQTHDKSIWFSSHKGLYRYHRETDTLRRFGKRQGFLGEEFNGYSGVTLSDGRLVFGSMSGITIVEPNVTISDPIPPLLTVTDISISGNEIPLPLHQEQPISLQLNYDDFGIVIKASALNFDQDTVEYRFSLTGEENIAFPVSKTNEIQLTQLAPGDSRLEITAKSLINGKVSLTSVILFTIKPPFYLTSIAYIIYALLLCSAFFGVWYVLSRNLLISHSQLAYRENRLRLALHGSNSEVWEWNARDEMVMGQRIVDSYIQAPKCSFKDYLSIIHTQDINDYQSQWNAFIHGAGDDMFNCQYRLRDSQGNWHWFRDVGKVVERDPSGKPILISGAYTNITESEADKEKALLYGEALRHSQDWVLIIDANMRAIRANKAFATLFNLPQDGSPFSPLQLNFQSNKIDHYRNILKSLNVQSHWRGEDTLFTLTGEKYNVLINITVSRNPTSKALYYLVVLTDITSRKLAEDELRYLANYDTLTNLPNRKYFVERVNHLLAKSHRNSDLTFAVLFIDLDKFKNVNDTQGHSAGDRLLAKIGKLFSDELRPYDIVARFGGDEFIILIDDFSDQSDLVNLCQRLNKVLELPVELERGSIKISASIGIARFPDDGSSVDTLFKCADLAMYASKRQSLGSYAFFSRDMDYALTQRMLLETALRNAVVSGEFFNYYQPIIDSRSNNIVGVELLLRWQYQGEVQSIGPYVNAIEELGLMVELTTQRVEQALVDLKLMLKETENVYLSVNIAASHIAKMELVNFSRDMITKYQLQPCCLRYEMTENALIEDGEGVSEVMQGLSQLGVKIALDDFGTGFSSLSYLRQLPVDVIKIDRSFVSGICDSAADKAIIDATVALSQALEISCIAEGVETTDELSYLQSRKCYLIQGYLFSKPLPLDKLLALLKVY